MSTKRRRGARASHPDSELGPPRKRRKLSAIPAAKPSQAEERHRHTNVPARGRHRPGMSHIPRHRRGGGAKTQPRHAGDSSARRAIAPSAPPSPPPSLAQELLRKAQQVVDLNTDDAGRRPCVMDVILNAKPPVFQYSEDIVMEALERSAAALPRQRVAYVVEDGGILDQSSGDQVALRQEIAVHEVHYLPGKRYQVSAERSTASWSIGQGDSSPRSSPSSSVASRLTLNGSPVPDGLLFQTE